MWVFLCFGKKQSCFAVVFSVPTPVETCVSEVTFAIMNTQLRNKLTMFRLQKTSLAI